MTSLKDISGIDTVYSARLEAAGVHTAEELLEAGAMRKERTDLAERSGVSETLLLKWVNRADLSRIKGVATEYADLLEAAGVDSVPELAQRRADHLTAKLQEINAQKR